MTDTATQHETPPLAGVALTDLTGLFPFCLDRAAMI